MGNHTKPSNILLSIGMIFKNEIRCLERCLQSLQPLRDAIPCELVMADTGSDDGSREIAAQYADILFDFPWVKDFSAARNVVLERCSGLWNLTIDCDEWLEDITPLVNFLTSPERDKWVEVLICQRNYLDKKQIENYEDAPVPRLFKAHANYFPVVRYIGAIHERPLTGKTIGKDCFTDLSIILHHDGYLYEAENSDKPKSKRNIEILQNELHDNPKSLRILTQCMDSAVDDNQRLQFAEQLMEVLHEGNYDNEEYVGLSYREAVLAAVHGEKYEQAEEWLKEGLEKCPESILLRMDGNGWISTAMHKLKRYHDLLLYSLEWHKAIREYEQGAGKDQVELQIFSLSFCTPYWKFLLSCASLNAACEEKEWSIAEQFVRDLSILETIVEPAAIRLMVKNLLVYGKYFSGGADCLKTHWNRAITLLDSPNENEKSKGQDIIKLILEVVKDQLPAQKQAASHANHTNINIECAADDTYYAMLQVMADTGDCDLGRSARILLCDSPDAIYSELCHVNRWEHISTLVLAHAVHCNAVFPDSFYRLPSETMAQIASRIAREDECFTKTVLTVYENEAQTLPELLWQTNLAAVAMFQADWFSDEEGQQLCDLFARLEKTLTSYLYHFENINEETLNILPPLHRFGWCLLQGLNALEQNNPKEYIRLLHQGLQEMPEMYKAVAFMVDHVENHLKRRPASAPPELLQLAEQVRAILAQYPPDNPMVLEIKKSPVYQRVAYLIENPASPPIEGMKQ